jgi:DNA (cytosine-5)-methyltransferase 1
LWSLYVDTIQRARPYVFVLENVPDFLRSEQYQSLVRETRGRGRLSDYELVPDVLDASRFGAAQRRRRALVIGRLRELPDPGMLPVRGTGPVTVRQVLKNVDPYIPRTRTQLPRVVGPYRSHELHLTRNVSDLSYQRFLAVPPGGNRFDLPDELQAPCWRRHTSGSGDVMGRLRWDQPSVTIRTEFYKPEKGRYLHPEQPRPISHYEAALIQGFPSRFKWFGSKTSIGRQIGNAVPIPLGRSIAEHVGAFLDENVTGLKGVTAVA